jgi:CRP-like cAMP-binding protein
MTDIGPLSFEAADRLAKRLVAKHPFPGASHAALERLMAQGDVRKLEAWEVLCDEGESGDEMWFLLRGTIEVQRKDLNGDARQLGTIDAPALIGHMALVDHSPRSATCVAQTNVELVVVRSDLYERLLFEASVTGSSLRRLLLSSLSGQLVSANGQIRQLVDDLCGEEPAPPPVAPAKPTPSVKRKKRSTEDRMARLSAQLGGWDADLEELEELEQEIELIVDEDQKRMRERNKGLI